MPGTHIVQRTVRLPGGSPPPCGSAWTTTETPLQVLPPGDEAPAFTGTSPTPAPFVSSHGGTSLPVSRSVTVQSSRVVPGRFAIRPRMQGALTYWTMLLAMSLQRGREVVLADRQHEAVGAELAHQLGDAHAGIGEAAVGRRARMRDHGPRAGGRAARRVGACSAPSSCTVYGVAGPVIAATMIWLVVALERLDPVRRCRGRRAGSPSVSFDVQSL